jgi:hypothetical protein
MRINRSAGCACIPAAPQGDQAGGKRKERPSMNAAIVALIVGIPCAAVAIHRGIGALGLAKDDRPSAALGWLMAALGFAFVAGLWCEPLLLDAIRQGGVS